MIKKLITVLFLAAFILISAQPALADGVPGSIYVDTAYAGSEDGTQAKPYNTVNEARALARSMPGGAWIYLKQGDTWNRLEYVKPVVSGVTGIPLATAAIYALLAVLTLGLLFVGWQFQRRARQTAG